MTQSVKQMLVLKREGIIQQVSHGNREKTGDVPMLTWADWELLQELHKEQAAKKSRFAALQKGGILPLPDEACNLYSPDDTQGFALNLHHAAGARPASEPAPVYRRIAEGLLSGTIRLPSHLVEGVPHDHHKKCVDELQDQIKDWEAKCRMLEDEVADFRNALSTALEIKKTYLEQNRLLSESLQRYRAAYFADHGDEVPPNGAKAGS